VKGLADRLQKISVGDYVTHRHAGFTRLNQRQHSVIGRDEDVVVGLRDDWTPCAAYARIDHNDMHATRRKKAIRLRNGPRGIQQVERRDRVADIDDPRFWMDAQDNPVHDPDEGVLQSEIGGEGNDTRLSHDLHASRMRRGSQAVETNSVLAASDQHGLRQEREYARC